MSAHALILTKIKKIKKNQIGFYKRIKLKEMEKSQKGKRGEGKPK
jgi:hypothetical protein